MIPTKPVNIGWYRTKFILILESDIKQKNIFAIKFEIHKDVAIKKNMKTFLFKSIYLENSFIDSASPGSSTYPAF